MKIISTVFLVAAALRIVAQENPCLFPLNKDVDSALVHVWLASKPGLNAGQIQKIKQKRASKRHPKELADSLWKVTQGWLLDRLGEEIVCSRVIGNFPNFIHENDSLFGMEFHFLEKPFDHKSGSFPFQFNFRKIGRFWKMEAPDFLPSCRSRPADCTFVIDEEIAYQLAAEYGIVGTDKNPVWVRSRQWAGRFHYQILKTDAAGECQDSIWVLDRRTGQFSSPTVERNHNCTTLAEMVEETPIIVEVQELGDGQSFMAGDQIYSKHGYRVLQVLKGDSIPDFIEVVRSGGRVKQMESDWSHGTFRPLSMEKTGILFLEDLPKRYQKPESLSPEFFKYKPYWPKGDQFAYGVTTPTIRQAVVDDVEHQLLQTIEQMTGKPRQRRQVGELRDKALIRKLREWGYGYRSSWPSLMAKLEGDSEELYFGLTLESSPIPVYLDSVDIHIRYDTSLLGVNPVAQSIVTVLDSFPFGNLAISKKHSLNLTDVRPGVFSLKMVSKTKDRRDPDFAFQPNGIEKLVAIFLLDLPKARTSTIEFQLVDFDEQPGGRYWDFAAHDFKPLGFVAGVSSARIKPTVSTGIGDQEMDTVKLKKGERSFNLPLRGKGFNDPALEFWVPVKIIGENGGFIPTYMQSSNKILSINEQGRLSILLSNGALNRAGTEMPIRLRSGLIYMAKPFGKVEGELRAIGYLEMEE